MRGGKYYAFWRVKSKIKGEKSTTIRKVMLDGNGDSINASGSWASDGTKSDTLNKKKEVEMLLSIQTQSMTAIEMAALRARQDSPCPDCDPEKLLRFQPDATSAGAKRFDFASGSIAPPANIPLWTLKPASF